MSALPPLILASNSPRRSELLRGLGYAFEVRTSGAAEMEAGELSGTEMARLNAFRKARAVAREYPDCLVIGADTVVYLGTKSYAKPADRPAATGMLLELQGHTHEVITGVCLMHLRQRRGQLFSDSTSVTFRPLTMDQIERYLAKINPLDKAGAYAIQEHGDEVVASIAGSFNNVVGLPVERLEQALRAWG